MAEPRRVGTPATPRGLQINQGQGGPSPASILGAISGAIASRGGQGGGGTGSMPAPQGGGVGAGIANAGQSIGDALQRAQERKFISKRDAEQRAFIKEQTDEQQRYAERNMRLQTYVERALAYREFKLRLAESYRKAVVNGDVDPEDVSKVLDAANRAEKQAWGMDPFAIAKRQMEPGAVEGTAAPLFGPEMNEAAGRQDMMGGGVMGTAPKMRTPTDFIEQARSEAEVTVMTDVLSKMHSRGMRREQVDLLLEETAVRLGQADEALNAQIEPLKGDYRKFVRRYFQEVAISQVKGFEFDRSLGSMAIQSLPMPLRLAMSDSAGRTPKLGSPDVAGAMGRALDAVPSIKRLVENAKAVETRVSNGEIPRGTLNHAELALGRLHSEIGITEMGLMDEKLRKIRGKDYDSLDADEKLIVRDLVERLVPAGGAPPDEGWVANVGPGLVNAAVTSWKDKLSAGDLAGLYLKAEHARGSAANPYDPRRGKLVGKKLLASGDAMGAVQKRATETGVDFFTALEQLVYDGDDALQGSIWWDLVQAMETPEIEVDPVTWDATETVVSQLDPVEKSKATQSYLDLVNQTLRDPAARDAFIESGALTVPFNPYDELPETSSFPTPGPELPSPTGTPEMVPPPGPSWRDEFPSMGPQPMPGNSPAIRMGPDGRPLGPESQGSQPGFGG